MRVSKLIEELKKFPPDANARAYEGEVCGIVVEKVLSVRPTGTLATEHLGVIAAHESESTADWRESRTGS